MIDPNPTVSTEPSLTHDDASGRLRLRVIDGRTANALDAFQLVETVSEELKGLSDSELVARFS